MVVTILFLLLSSIYHKMAVTILFLLLSSIYQKMAVTILFLLLSSILFTASAQPRNTIIRPGSSFSPNNNSYWLSESGQFAFGFYPYGNGFSETAYWSTGTSNAGDNVTLNLDSNDGMFRLYSHSFNQSGNWSIEWSSSNNRCNPKGLCGPEGPGMSKNYSADACTRKSEHSFDVYELSSVTWEEDPYGTLQEL
ncbi:Uncharacterized protein TCM_035509 [Theobroma cacao]|uniref:Uncharacterized protein n=1 Tax=Theobroma cacao TaxID=3641 RepID=A0A061FQA9_THECC|nr:Uncharacterized protein TCM_035509 [Theobroma cacao]